MLPALDLRMPKIKLTIEHALAVRPSVEDAWQPLHSRGVGNLVRAGELDVLSTPSPRRLLDLGEAGEMPRWQDRLFIALAKSASNASDFFQIPTRRVVEVGTQVTI
jgi:K+ transporter